MIKNTPRNIRSAGYDCTAVLPVLLACASSMDPLAARNYQTRAELGKPPSSLPPTLARRIVVAPSTGRQGKWLKSISAANIIVDI